MSKHTIKFYKLKELCNDIIDCPHSTPIWRNQGIPIIRNYNLSNDILTPHNLSYVDEKTYLERIKRAKPEVNDIIISREAPMGAVGLVPHNFICCLGQRTVLLKVNKNKCLPQYLFYALMSKFVQKQIQIINQTGSIVSNLNITDLKNLIVPIVDNQNKIALLLTNILEKIRSNNKINAELEAMTKTIYDYWFLQFEFPNEDGKPYKSSGGKMVWNEELKREIPEGWSYEYISNISKIIAGGDKDENIQVNCDKDHTIPVYSNSEKNKGLYGFTQKATLEEPCITVSARGTIGLSFIRLEPFVPIIRLICVIPNNIEYLKFLEISLNKIDYRKNGSIQQQLTVPQLASYKFIFPNKIILEKYHKLTMNIQKKILENEKENQELISLRDFLLPLLMNGQVGFKEDKAEG